VVSGPTPAAPSPSYNSTALAQAPSLASWPTYLVSPGQDRKGEGVQADGGWGEGL
jgi:hypothetical protein